MGFEDWKREADEKLGYTAGRDFALYLSLVFVVEAGYEAQRAFDYCYGLVTWCFVSLLKTTANSSNHFLVLEFVVSFERSSCKEFLENQIILVSQSFLRVLILNFAQDASAGPSAISDARITVTLLIHPQT